MYGFLTVISVWWLYRKKRTDIKNAAESLISGPAAASPSPCRPRFSPLLSARVQLQPVGLKDADCYLLQVREKIYEGRRRKMQIVLAV